MQSLRLCGEPFRHFDLITKRSGKNFIATYNAWTKKKGYRPSESKAKEIYALAKNGTPILSSRMPSTKMLSLESTRLLNTANLTLRTILSQMYLLVSEFPEYSVVSAMKGLGSQLSIPLIPRLVMHCMTTSSRLRGALEQLVYGLLGRKRGYRAVRGNARGGSGVRVPCVFRRLLNVWYLRAVLNHTA